MITAYIACGSNLGDGPGTILAALHFLETHYPINIRQCSRFYRSPALLPDDAPLAWDLPFTNNAVEVETALAPDALLAALKEAEARAGRIPNGHWAPRELDMDIIFYGDAVHQSSHLTLPHPQMPNRDFVLLPLNDIAPHWVHPVLHLTVQELCAKLSGSTAKAMEVTL